MKKKHILILTTAALIILIGFKLWSAKNQLNENKNKNKQQAIRIPVTSAEVSEQTREINIIKTGSFAPYKEAKIMTVTSGNIQSFRFSLGDEVKQGEVIAVMDTRLLQLDLQKSESNASKLRRDLQTYKELQQGNAATQEKVNEIQQNYNDASNQSLQIKRQISDASIKAPTSGVIASKLAEEGMFLPAGTEIASIVNLSKLKIQVTLTESEVYQIRPAQQVRLTTDIYPGKEFKATVTYISPQADQTHSYQAELTAVNQKDTPLRAGTFVYADFSRKTQQKVLLIPREALTQSARDASVYVIEKNKAVIRKIRTGASYGNKVEILDGLRKGEQVVVSGQINLQDGSLITVSK